MNALVEALLVAIDGAKEALEHLTAQLRSRGSVPLLPDSHTALKSLVASQAD